VACRPGVYFGLIIKAWKIRHPLKASGSIHELHEMNMIFTLASVLLDDTDGASEAYADSAG
jgi:hypothetical protein